MLRCGIETKSQRLLRPERRTGILQAAVGLLFNNL